MNDACEDMFSRTDDHTKVCSQMDGRANMQDVLRNGRMDEHAPFANRWDCQVFQHASKEQHAKASSSNAKIIEESAHCAMQRLSYDTPWIHPSLNNALALLALQQQHECTSIVMSSHESCCPHLHYGLVVNQCDVTCKSKRPTCWT